MLTHFSFFLYFSSIYHSIQPIRLIYYSIYLINLKQIKFCQFIQFIQLYTHEQNSYFYQFQQKLLIFYITNLFNYQLYIFKNQFLVKIPYIINNRVSHRPLFKIYTMKVSFAIFFFLSYSFYSIQSLVKSQIYRHQLHITRIEINNPIDSHNQTKLIDSNSVNKYSSAKQNSLSENKQNNIFYSRVKKQIQQVLKMKKQNLRLQSKQNSGNQKLNLSQDKNEPIKPTKSVQLQKLPAKYTSFHNQTQNQGINKNKVNIEHISLNSDITLENKLTGKQSQQQTEKNFNKQPKPQNTINSSKNTNPQSQYTKDNLNQQDKQIKKEFNQNNIALNNEKTVVASVPIPLENNIIKRQQPQKQSQQKYVKERQKGKQQEQQPPAQQGFWAQIDQFFGQWPGWTCDNVCRQNGGTVCGFYMKSCCKYQCEGTIIHKCRQGKLISQQRLKCPKQYVKQEKKEQGKE